MANAKTPKTSIKQFNVLADSYIDDRLVPAGSTINLTVDEDFVAGANLQEIDAKGNPVDSSPAPAPAPAPSPAAP